MRLELEGEVRMDIRQGPDHAWSCGLFEEFDIILQATGNHRRLPRQGCGRTRFKFFCLSWTPNLPSIKVPQLNCFELPFCFACKFYLLSRCKPHLHFLTKEVGEGNGTPLQYFCLENPMDGGAWWAAVHGVARVGHHWATSLSLFTFIHWRRKWQPTPVFLPGESQGRGSLVGCRLWDRTESDMTEAT